MTWEQQIGGFVLSAVCFGLLIEYLTGRSPKSWLKETKKI